MRFFAVRHGMAKSKEEDSERPLNDKGIAETEKVARFLKPLGIEVDAIYHSGKARARMTAEIVSRTVRSTNGVKQRSGIDPDDDVKKFAKEINKLEVDIMIAGHQPFLGKLSSYLLTGDPDAGIVNFALSGIICFERIGDKWQLQWMISPEVL